MSKTEYRNWRVDSDLDGLCWLPSVERVPGETGEIALADTSAELLNNDQVKKAYLGE